MAVVLEICAAMLLTLFWLLIMESHAAIAALYFIWAFAPGFIIISLLLAIFPGVFVFAKQRKRGDLLSLALAVGCVVAVAAEAASFWFISGERWRGPGG
jgi:hypothetical protein